MLAIVAYTSCLYSLNEDQQLQQQQDDDFGALYNDTGSLFLLVVSCLFLLAVILYTGLVMLPVSRKCLMRDDELEPLIAAEAGKSKGSMLGIALTTSALSTHNSQTGRRKEVSYELRYSIEVYNQVSFAFRYFRVTGIRRSHLEFTAATAVTMEAT